MLLPEVVRIPLVEERHRVLCRPDATLWSAAAVLDFRVCRALSLITHVTWTSVLLTSPPATHFLFRMC